MPCKFLPKRLLERLRDGYETDSGDIVHAVCRSERGLSWMALCGAKPREKSAGWGTYDEEDIICPKCLEKLINPPEFKIARTIEPSSEMLLIQYDLLQDGEVCGYWLLRINHQNFFNGPLSWGIYFKDEFRGCCCFLDCNRSDFLISEVATKHESGGTIYVKRFRLNKYSTGLFERMEAKGFVKIGE